MKPFSLLLLLYVDHGGQSSSRLPRQQFFEIIALNTAGQVEGEASPSS